MASRVRRELGVRAQPLIEPPLDLYFALSRVVTGTPSITVNLTSTTCGRRPVSRRVRAGFPPARNRPNRLLRPFHSRKRVS